MKIYLNYFLIGCFISGLLYFMRDAFSRFSNAVRNTVDENIFRGFRESVNNLLDSLKHEKRAEFFKDYSKYTILLFIVFSIGLLCSVIDCYLYDLALQAVIPSAMNEITGVRVDWLIAVMLVLAGLFIGMLFFDIFFSGLNLLPDKIIKKMRKSNLLKIVFTSMLVLILCIGTTLTYLRFSMGTDVKSKDEQLYKATLYSSINNDILSKITEAQNEGIKKAMVGFLTASSIMFTGVSMIGVSLGYNSFIVIVKILVYYLLIVILTIILGLTNLASKLTPLLMSLIMSIVYVISEPFNIILNSHGNRKDKNDKDKTNKLGLMLIFALLLTSTGCSNNKRIPVSLCIIVDLSGSFTDYVYKARDDIKNKILPCLHKDDEFYLLSISDNSFDEDKSILYHAKLPTEKHWADKTAGKIIEAINLDCIKKLDEKIAKESYQRTDILRAVFYGSYILERAEVGRKKMMVIFSDLNDNIKSDSRKLINLEDVEVIVLYADHDKNEVEFLNKVKKWEDIFKEAGASKISIYEPLLSRNADIIKK